jgi:hypothetical protein
MFLSDLIWKSVNRSARNREHQAIMTLRTTRAV